MKIKANRAILFLIALLALTMLTGCPPTMPPVDKISAKEAWDIMKSAQETLPDDAVPVYIKGTAMKPESPIEEGKAGIWDIGFYSESENAVLVVHLYNEKNSEPAPLLSGICYDDISLTAYDLADWEIDSAEACEIAVQNGAGKTESMSLRSARFNLQNYENYPFEIYSFIPESTKLCWVIRAGDVYCIDASTGEYLGSYAT
ncbi:MAG TPA: hypothetical protein PK629_02650 [Oscillospiraceae bacterium]|nr:hypothetical protein [Oscillospiraceae bacterium]HPK34225.1 hypothetical protein [Oscillospiraceae bacterium]HPR74872.1 hypothetical protein [Oscillospiraceae bacterium]